MSISMPKIEINFNQKATSLIERSERGYAVLIIRDETDISSNYKIYKNITEVEKDSALYTKENLQYLNDAFEFGTYRVIAVRIGLGTEEAPVNINTAFSIIENNIDTGWITICDGTNEEYSALAKWIKDKEKEKKTYKAVVYQYDSADSMHVVNFTNNMVTFKDSRGMQSGVKYLPCLVGILASCNVVKGSTYFKCTNLSSVEEVEDNDAALNSGKFILFNDKDYVRIASDINSLVTTSGTAFTEDMKYIETVEVMDLILDDIREEFKNNYLGIYRNKYDNQVLLISSINGYFKDLAKEDILDPEYENVATINVEAQREDLISSGKVEAADWDDATVRKTTYKRNIYLSGDIKILGSMSNLEFDISLF